MPKKSVHEQMKVEALRLRIDERLGAAEIGRRTGVPKSVLHYWLKPYPLTDEEKSAVISAAPRHRTPKKQLPVSGEVCELADGISTLGRGSVAENYAKFDIARNGLLMMNPDGDGDVVDIYVRRNGGHKVAFLQVRTASKPPARNGLPSISLRRYRNGKANSFKEGDFHFIVGYCPANNQVYVYSYDEVRHLRNSITITPEAAGAWWKVMDWLDGKIAASPAPRRAASAVPRKAARKGGGKTRRMAA